MNYYTQISCNPTTADWIPGYMDTIPALIAHHGGRYLYQTTDYVRIEETSTAPGLGITPKMEVLGKPVVIVE